MGMKKIKEEFKKENFYLNHDQPEHFVQSQWQHGSLSYPYLLYRWILAIFFLTVVIVSWSGTTNAELWLIYLTNWGISICAFTNLLAACLVTAWAFRHKKPEYVPEFLHLPILYRMFWWIHTGTTSVAFGITIIYWSVLYTASQPLDATNLLTHAFNSILMFVDVFIVKHPVRLLHVYQPFIIAFVYLIFNLIFYAAGGTDGRGNPYVYNILDWRNPGMAMITVVGGLCFVIILHSVVFGMYRLRMFTHRKIKRRTGLPVTVQTVSGEVNPGFSKDDN